ncbi:MAG: hypothetical protein J3K34DRAFT_417605 [Monoraphidium minutum]|nr:MAG: hypothetical protein J3K34DRAFT_417605 [Monoraphidium minutum]
MGGGCTLLVLARVPGHMLSTQGTGVRRVRRRAGGGARNARPTWADCAARGSCLRCAKRRGRRGRRRPCRRGGAYAPWRRHTDLGLPEASRIVRQTNSPGPTISSPSVKPSAGSSDEKSSALRVQGAEGRCDTLLQLAFLRRCTRALGADAGGGECVCCLWQQRALQAPQHAVLPYRLAPTRPHRACNTCSRSGHGCGLGWRSPARAHVFAARPRVCIWLQSPRAAAQAGSTTPARAAAGHAHGCTHGCGVAAAAAPHASRRTPPEDENTLRSL